MEKMIAIGKRPKLFLLVLFLLFGIYPFAGHCLTLITPEEAAQPDAPTMRGIELSRMEDKGPQIKISSPQLDEPLRTPFVIDITFEASPDKIIDYDSLRVKYVKLIHIDLTDRLKPHLDNNRLIVRDVKVPYGKHCLQVFVAYTSGEKTMMKIVLDVER